MKSLVQVKVTGTLKKIVNRYSYKVKVLSLFNTHLFNLFVLHNYMYILMVWSFWGSWNNVNVMHIWARMTSCVSDKGPHTTLRYWGLNVKFELITGNQWHFSKIKYLRNINICQNLFSVLQYTKSWVASSYLSI